MPPYKLIVYRRMIYLLLEMAERQEIPPDVSLHQVQALLDAMGASPDTIERCLTLSAREARALGELLREEGGRRQTAQKAARRMGIRLSTFKTYVQRGYRKLGIHRREEIPLVLAVEEV